MSQRSLDVRTELSWLERIGARLRGHTPADMVLSKIITQCIGSWRPWMQAKDKGLVAAAVDQGANLDLAIDLAMTVNPVVAYELMELGARPTIEGFQALAQHALTWVQSPYNALETGELNWAWTEFARHLVVQYPHHEGWVQQAGSSKWRVISAVGRAQGDIEFFHRQKNPQTAHEVAQQLLSFVDPVADIQWLMLGRTGPTGEGLTELVQLSLVQKALERQPELSKNADLLARAVGSQSWLVVDVCAQLASSIPERALTEGIDTLMKTRSVRNSGLSHTRAGLDSFIDILGRDLPPDYDLDTFFEFKLDVFDLATGTQPLCTPRMILGIYADKVDAQLRQRKLMDLVQERVDNANPVATAPAPRL